MYPHCLLFGAMLTHFREDDMERTIELFATAKGLVQGVFFRKAVKKQADSIGVKGYVCNLSDGCVQIVAQGSKNELEKFIEKIRTNPGRGRVDNLILDYRKPKESYRSFNIRH